jgi:outer membrane protein OmpA-like peptidoglycan-associated protein
MFETFREEDQKKMTLKKYFFIVASLISLSFFIGCAGMEMTSRKDFLFHPKELVDAERALKEARCACKDMECPEDFKAVENMVNKAYETYRACRTEEAIKMAKDAINKANALCPGKPKPVVQKFEKVIDRLTLRVNFDLDKSDIRPRERAELQKAITFIRKYPRAKVRLEGHTDSIATEEYNQRLSERRADAVMDYLVKEGACAAANITTVGYGESRPVASNDTEEGRAQNRRVEVLILSE